MSNDETQPGGVQSRKAAPHLRLELHVRPDETPLLAQWLTANRHVWARAVREYLESAISNGVLPAEVPAMRRADVITQRRRRSRKVAAQGEGTRAQLPQVSEAVATPHAVNAPAPVVESAADGLVSGQISTEPTVDPAMLPADQVTSGSETASPPGAALGPRDAFIPQEQSPSVPTTQPQDGGAPAPTPTHVPGLTEAKPEPGAGEGTPRQAQPSSPPLDARAIARNALLKNQHI